MNEMAQYGSLWPASWQGDLERLEAIEAALALGPLLAPLPEDDDSEEAQAV